jgi:hypothetical protein
MGGVAMDQETEKLSASKTFYPSKTFLKGQEKLFWLGAGTLILGSAFILHALHGYFLTQFFQMLLCVQVVWCIGIVFFFHKFTFAWHGMTVTTLPEEISIEKKKQRSHLPYPSIQKLIVEMRHHKIAGFKLEAALQTHPIRIHVEDADAFYEILKTKIGNPFKIAIQTRAPLAGFSRIAVPALPLFIVLVMSFRAFMAFEAISMRPDLGISYENWLFLVIFEFGLGISLAAQVWLRKRLAYAVSLLIGVIFLFGIIRAILYVDLKDTPRWYEALFMVYAGVLTLANCTALFLIVANPPARLETHDLGLEPANPIS